MIRTELKSFLLKVRKSSRCWIWLGPCRGRYGALYLSGKKISAHRAAWILFRGPIPEGLDVLHKCDNRLCVKPSHLFLGTDIDNMQDCVRKGRIAFGIRQGLAKLTDGKVLEIRASHHRFTKTQLAKEYDVSRRTIANVINRVIWKHV